MSETGRFKCTLVVTTGQSLLSLLIGWVVKTVFFSVREREVTSKESLQMGALTLFSMFCSNNALRYVSYPIQALFKSAKILSILVLGIILGRSHKVS